MHLNARILFFSESQRSNAVLYKNFFMGTTMSKKQVFLFESISAKNLVFLLAKKQIRVCISIMCSSSCKIICNLYRFGGLFFKKTSLKDRSQVFTDLKAAPINETGMETLIYFFCLEETEIFGLYELKEKTLSFTDHYNCRLQCIFNLSMKKNFNIHRFQWKKS